MATRSAIGYETAGGSYVGVYCHYDGYPKYMGPILHRMFHADVVIMVSKALAGGGIRCIDEDGTYEIFNDRPSPAVGPHWPCLAYDFAYRKCLDGRVEWTNDGRSFQTWEPNVS